jgi:ribosomal protein S18 acetylase RimI-like enzyme
LSSTQLHFNSSVTIRPARSQDLYGMAEVLANSFHPPVGLFFWMYPLFRMGIYEDLRNRLQASRPYYTCLVATLPVNSLGETETVVATVEIALRSTHSCSFIGAKYPYISNLAVRQAYRRQGIAVQLLLKCEEIAFEWGYQKLALHVLQDNYPAQQLYFSQGYHLEKTDSDFSSWLFSRPKRLLLIKSLSRE